MKVGWCWRYPFFQVSWALIISSGFCCSVMWLFVTPLGYALVSFSWGQTLLRTEYSGVSDWFLSLSSAKSTRGFSSDNHCESLPDRALRGKSMEAPRCLGRPGVFNSQTRPLRVFSNSSVKFRFSYTGAVHGVLKARTPNTERWTPQVSRCSPAAGGQRRNHSRKNEESEPKQKQHRAVDVAGDGSKVQKSNIA